MVTLNKGTWSDFTDFYVRSFPLSSIKQACDLSEFFLISGFSVIYKPPFASKCSWKKRCSHQGKKEVACFVSKPCLWGCGESVNPPQLNIQEVHGGFVLWTKGRPRPATNSSGFFTFVKSHPWVKATDRLYGMIHNSVHCVVIKLIICYLPHTLAEL